jgi:8-oxo-dGTP pyrophosphatase MutT (NUDIX family)
MLAAISPWDNQERSDLRFTNDWMQTGAPIYRTRKPDEPDIHLVSYFVVADPHRQALLLVEHINAGLLLPPGGHVEPLEHPWVTVERECPEELFIEAEPLPQTGTAPFFATATVTRGPGRHTDVSLWFCVSSEPSDVIAYDPAEFHSIRWMTADDILQTPIDLLDPNLHRATRKLSEVLGWR